MKEYIEREAAISILNAKSDMALGTPKQCFAGAAAMLEKLPAADVEEVRHGLWVWNENAMDWGIGGWVCSECRAKNDNIPAKPDIHPSAWVGSQYCPHCGSKMDKEG